MAIEKEKQDKIERRKELEKKIQHRMQGSKTTHKNHQKNKQKEVETPKAIEEIPTEDDKLCTCILY